MQEPEWLAKHDVLRLHDEVIDLTGGAAGVRDEGLLDSALARPLNRFAYEQIDDLAELAATYGVAVAKNHPFVDGNKRAAFYCLGVFLELNGHRLMAEEDDATRVMLGVAAGEIDIDRLAAWIRDNSAQA